MNSIRNIILAIFGLKFYLQIISKIYITAVSCGLWRKKYPELFYLDSIIKPGDTCIDIGANLGYYTTRMSKLVGTSGKVYAIEPIPLFGRIWTGNVKPRKNKQVQLYGFALGEKECMVQMGIPEKNGRIHHGMTKITNSANEHYTKFFDVPMKNPDALFKDLQRLDFVKCDVEGYEFMVFSNFTKTLQKFKPLVQTELGGAENRQNVIALFESLGYSLHLLQNNTLVKITKEEAMLASQDFYFLSE